MKDISNNMKYVGRRVAVCNHFCNNKPYNGRFYDWYSFFENKLLKTMCEKCALREVWGYNYKQNKHYKKWI